MFWKGKEEEEEAVPQLYYFIRGGEASSNRRVRLCPCHGLTLHFEQELSKKTCLP